MGEEGITTRLFILFPAFFVNRPKPFAFFLVQFALLQFAETFAPFYHRFDRDEIDEVIRAVGENGIAEPNQSARFAARPKPARRHRPKQSAAHTPNRLVGVDAGANPIHRARHFWQKQKCDEAKPKEFHGELRKRNF